MRVRLIAFATAAEILDGREASMELASGSTVGDLLDLLADSKPGFAGLRPRIAVAVDGRMARPGDILTDGAEVALLPPVSGGKPAARDRLTHQPIDVAAVLEDMEDPSCGAQLLFLGCVRSEPGRPVTHLVYEAYEQMAAEALERICREISANGSVRVSIVHRLGEVPLGEPSVAIATASPHRAEAYEASRRALERLKREVPIWKQENFDDGSASWREEEPLTVSD